MKENHKERSQEGKGISRTTVKNYIHAYEQKKQALMPPGKVDQEKLIPEIVSRFNMKELLVCI